jgi:hypothetical protein
MILDYAEQKRNEHKTTNNENPDNINKHYIETYRLSATKKIILSR